MTTARTRAGTDSTSWCESCLCESLSDHAEISRVVSFCTGLVHANAKQIFSCMFWPLVHTQNTLFRSPNFSVVHFCKSSTLCVSVCTCKTTVWGETMDITPQFARARCYDAEQWLHFIVCLNEVKEICVGKKHKKNKRFSYYFFMFLLPKRKKFTARAQNVLLWYFSYRWPARLFQLQFVIVFVFPCTRRYLV